MGSPITFSGFNNFDFNAVLTAIMQQESRPLTALQTQQTVLRTEVSAFTQLATKLGALQAATYPLSDDFTFTQYAVSSNDTSRVSVSASGTPTPGQYDVKVNTIARKQVTVSTPASALNDADTTVVATGGSITISGEQINVTGSVTLNGLRDLINADDDSLAAASVMQTSPGKYSLVLTSKDTGLSNAFTFTKALTGGTKIGFTDTDTDNTYGDSAADNVVQAVNASVLIDGVTVTSATNTLDDVIQGVSLTALQEDSSTTVVVSAAHDDDDLVNRVKAFATAYNAVAQFTSDQFASAAHGTAGSIGHDAVLRSLRDAFRTAIGGAYGTATFTKLAEVGIGFDRDGNITVDETALRGAITTDYANVQSLFAGTGSAFTAVNTVITDYTKAGGFLSTAKTRANDQISRISDRIDDFQARLAIRRAELQKEFIAADQAISTLNRQSSSLSSIGASPISSSL